MQGSIFFVAIAPTGIGLPEFDQRVGNRTVVFIENPTMNDDAFANRIAILGIVADQVVIKRPQFVLTKDRTRDFRQGSLKGQSDWRGDRATDVL